MMKRSRWNKALVLVLGLVLLATTVSASGYTLDLSGDGQVNVWDIQLAVNGDKGAAHEEAILDNILGGGDELHPNADGIYEIYSVVGLRNMASHATEGATFKLMADIDLGGMDWTPVANFKGNLEGNGKTISNFKITKFVAGSDGGNMGFFGTVDHNGKDADGNNIQSVVKDLNLRDVTVTVPTDTGLDIRYIGLLSGSNRGSIENCTTVGTINDRRTMLANPSYLGTIVGRNNDSKPAGKISGTNGMTVLDTCETFTHTQKVHSMMAMDLAALEEGSKTRKIGIAGYSAEANIDTTLLWQDISNATTLADPVIQARRKTVVDHMYEMCTVEWTPTAQMQYHVYKSNTTKTTTTYKVGTTYRGIPYNHGSSGLDRFNASINDPNLPVEAYYFTDKGVVHALNNNTPDADGYVTVTEANYTADGKTLPAVNYVGQKVKVPSDWVQGTSTPSLAGFSRYIGSDCSSAAAWAWRQVSAVSGTGFANPQSTASMIPTTNYVNNAGTKKNGYITTYGIQPVNGLTFEHPYKDLDGDGVTDAAQDLNGDGTVNHSDNADMVEAVFAANNQVFWSALAGTSRGDMLVGFNDDGGHTRVAASDAIAVRTWNGKIDPKLSYIVTHEQGRGSSGTGWSSSCTVNFQYTFDMLTNYADYSKIGSKCCYFPVTCTALRVVDTPAATATCTMSNGKVTSNFHIVSTTVGEETVYTNTTLTGSRNRCTSVTLTTAHPAIAAGDTVTVLLSNGQTYTFTY